MKKILVLTDMSEFSDHAAKLAAVAADRAKAELHLLHMLPRADMDRGEVEGKMKKYITGTEGRKEFIHIEDMKTDDLPGYIREHNYGLVFIGSEGQNSVRKKILGSTVTEVLRISPSPVIIIRREFGPDIFNRMIFASDFEGAAMRHFENFQELARVFNARVDLVYIFTAFSPISREDAKGRMLNFKNSCRDVSCHHHIVGSNTVEDGIISFQKKNDIHFIALVTHSYSKLVRLLPVSLTEKIINKADAAVMSINVDIE